MTYISPAEYKAQWDAALAPTDHELVTDHSRCAAFWPECQEDTMICTPCKDNCHEECRGGTWCDCQHADRTQFPAKKT